MQVYSNNVNSRQIIYETTCGPQLLKQQNMGAVSGFRRSVASRFWNNKIWALFQGSALCGPQLLEQQNLGAASGLHNDSVVIVVS